jgi:ABC-type transport system involved in multi-copper enzyme maturation permease subunit
MRGRQIITIARFSLLEALRTRLVYALIAAMILILGAGYFAQQLAITESARVQTVFSAAALRFAAVFLLTLHVLTSVTREFDDKGLELTLSFDLRRSHYIAGRLLGFLSIALVIAAAASAPLFFLAPPAAALQWGVSLAFELAIMAAFSLFCIVTFTQLMPAASFVLGFYVLARALNAIQLMSDTPLTGSGTRSHQLASALVDLLALLLPSLDRYTQSAWLTDGIATGATFAALAAQALIYILLLAAAAMFDFYRRNL